MGVKWSFIVDVTDVKQAHEIDEIVEREANKVVESIGECKKPNIFRVFITFYQRRDRWLSVNPQIPREDIGRDLDNLIKPVLDNLGPIIGYRKKWGRDKDSAKPKVKGHGKSADSSIVEVIAKKVNSGSDKEFLSIEVENIIP